MNATSENTNLIERFVGGQCSRREERLVLHKMAVDADFAKAVKDYRVVFSGLKALRINEIEQELRTLAEEEGEVAEPDLVAELELVERYYHGKLSPTELSNFKKRQNTDQAFAQKVSDYQTIFSGLRTKRVQEIEAGIKQAADVKTAKVVSIHEKAKKSALRRLLPIFAAAAVLLGAVAILPMLLVSEGDFQSALLNEYGEKPSSSTLMSATTTLSPVEKAISLLNENKFQAAESLLAALDSDSAKIYLADAQFGQKEFAAALQNYQAAQTSKNIDLSNRADWFVVQCLLRIKPYDEKRLQESLNQISEKTGVHNYRKKAAALEQQLDSGFSKWQLKWSTLFL